jgi:hypothetical protein
MSSCAHRLPDSLKQAAKRIAAADETTMNQFFMLAIAEKINAMETAKFFEKRAAVANAATSQGAWDKVGSNDPMADDKWSQSINVKKTAQSLRNMRGQLLNF